jgi:putative transcriptional regulator
MPGKDKVKIKVYLKEHRLQAGLTQEELANRVGVRRETIVFLEQGAYNPSLKLALTISREINVPIDKLFSL